MLPLNAADALAPGTRGALQERCSILTWEQMGLCRTLLQLNSLNW